MKIITQLDLFDYSEIEVLGDLERLKYVIDNVPDDKIVEKLNDRHNDVSNDEYG